MCSMKFNQEVFIFFMSLNYWYHIFMLLK
jgi:hypothetical protein